MDLEVTTFDEEIVVRHCTAILENVASFQKFLGFYKPLEKEKTDRV